MMRHHDHAAQDSPVGRGRFIGWLLVLLCSLTMSSSLSAATCTWSGGGGDNNWTTAANWDAVPVGGEDLVFAGTTRLTPNNDFAADTSFASITFNSGAGLFVVTGNRITLAGTITNNGTNTQTIGLDLIMAATRTGNAASGDLTISGILSGAGGLTKTGVGTVTLSGVNVFTGVTTVSAGTLSVTGSTDAGSAVTISSGATLAGTGTVAGTVAVANGGTLAPGVGASLVASFVASDLRAVTQDDWRATQTITGTRSDLIISQAGNAFGTAGERAAYGIGGNDGDWDNFSVQWDGYLRVVTAGTTLSTRSDDGSRVWLDLNNNGVVDSGEWGSNGWGSGQGETTRTVHSGLAVGTYRMRVQYEEGNGGNAIYLLWSDAANSAGTVDSLYLVPANLLRGGSTIGTLATGAVTLNSTSTYTVDLHGTVPTYDQVSTAGAVTCAGTLTVGSIVNPVLGKVYTIISAGSVGGTFSGLANGDIFYQQGRVFQIAYTGTTVTLTDVVRPTTRVWDGGGADNNWTTAANWNFNIAPVAGDDLQFAGSTRLAPNNDFPADTSFASITFNSGAGAFVIGSAAITSGTISREVWTGVGGTNVASIPVGTAPNISDTLSSIETLTDWADNYGTRIRGFITAPTSGNYTFWVASDDDSELWLSTDTQSANKVLIGSVSGWTASREWGKYGSQKSSSIALTAGLKYYVEVLQKEGGGGDNLAVGWAKPGEPTTAPSEVIPGAYLSPYSNGYEIVLTGGITNNSTNLQTVNIWVVMAATRTVNCASGDVALGGILSGVGGLTKTGTGVLTLTGTNAFTGVTTISAGTLQIGNGTTDGSIATSSGITDNAALVYNLVGARSYGNVISGTGTLTKSGAGTLTLAGANTYSGATTVSGGTLLVTGSTAAASTVAVSSGATLGGTGTVGGTITLNAGGIIAPGIGGTTIGTLATAAVTCNATSVYSIDLDGTTPTYDQINSSGTVACAGTLTVASVANMANGKVFIIVNAASVSGTFSGLANGAMFTQQSRTFQIAYTATQVTLTDVARPTTRVWDGGSSVDNNWTTAANWDYDLAPVAGDDLQFAGSTRTSPVNNFTADTSFNSIIFNAGAAAFTLTNAGNRITLAGNVTNSSSNAQAINLAMVMVATRTFDTTGAGMTLGGVLSGAGGLTKSGANTLTLTATNTFTGTVTINAGTLSIGDGTTDGSIATSANVVNNGTLLYNNTTAKTYGNVISGTGALTKSGAGTLTLTATNTFTGTVTINAGTLSIGDGTTDGSIATSANVVNNGTLLYNNTTAKTYGNVISGTGVLTKTGAGTLTLTATNTFTGTVTINAGTLSIGDGTTDGSIATSANVVNNGTLLYNNTTAKTYGNVISGTGVLTKTGAGTLTLTATNTFTGGLSVTGGILSVAADARLGAVPGSATPGSITLNGGTLQFTGAAAITLNTNRGIAVGSSGGTINIAITPGAFTNSSDPGVHYSGIIADVTGQTGSLTVSGVGMLMLYGNSTYSGATTIDTGWISGPSTGGPNNNILPTTTVLNVINGGHFNLCTSGVTQSIAGLTGDATGLVGSTNQSSTATLTLNETGSYAFPGVLGPLTHPGKTGANPQFRIIKSGAGTQTLSGANTYTGPTTVSAGTLLVTGTMAASAIAVSSGATLGGTGTASGTVTMSATGTLAPGTGATPIATLSTGAVTCNATSVYSIDLNGTAPTADRVTSSGAVALNGTLTVASILNAAYLKTYTIVSGSSITGTFTGLPDRTVFTQVGRNFLISYTATTVTLTDMDPAYVWVWDGGGADDNWMTAANWVDDVAPGVGAALQFAGSLRTSPVNNFPLDTSFASITFNVGASPFTMLATGNRITLTGSVTNNSVATTQTINLPMVMAATRTLDAASGNLVIGGIISGAGGLTKAGANTLTLTASNSLTGIITISAGTLSVGDGTTDGTINTSASVVNNAALIYNNTTAKTYANVISGTGTLTKTGAGTLTLSGGSANTYSGLTSVNGGLLTLSKTAGVNAIAGNLTITNGLVSFVNSNQIADSCAVTMSGAGSVFNGNAVGAGLVSIAETIGSLTISGGAFNTGVTSTWAVTGALSFTGGAGNAIYVGNSGTQLTVGSLSVTGMTATAGGTQNTANSFTQYGNNTTTQSNITVGTGGLTLNGSVLNLRRGAAGALGSKLVLNGEVTTAGGTASSIIEDTNGGTNGSIAVELSGTAGAVTRMVTTIAGGADLGIGVPITNGAATPGALTKDGLGTLTFNGGTLANNYSGVTTVSDGTLVLQKTAGTDAIAGNISIGNASGSDVLRLGASNQIADTSIITFTSGGGGNSAKLELNGYLETVAGIQSNANQASVIQDMESGGAAGPANPAILTVNNTVDLVYDGLIRNVNSGGGSVGLTKSGTGTLTLRCGFSPAAITYTGATTLSAGKLVIDDLSGFTSAISDNSAAADALTFNQTTQTLTYGAVISGSGAVTKTGAGTLTLSGANTYTGATTGSAGTLKAGVASVANVSGAFGRNSAVTLANATGAVLDITGFDTQIGSLAGGGGVGGHVTLGAATLTTGGNDSSTTYAGVISGTGSLIKIGTGTQTLTNAHTYSGSSIITGGVVKLRQPQFRYYRFVPTKFKGLGAENSIQLSELQFFLNGTRIPATTVTNPGGNNPGAEGPANANDNNTATKWLDFNKLPIIYDFGAPQIISAYDWTTANDSPDRDAIRWRIEGSDDSTLWMILDDRTGADQAVTDTRFTMVAPGAVHFPLWSTASGVLPTTTALAIAVGASLDLGGNSQQVASLADYAGNGGSVTNSGGSNSAFTIGGSATTTFSGVVSDGGTNQIALTHSGSGAQTLAGANTYTGATTIGAGTLFVTGSTAAGSAVAVDSGGTLGGTGTVAGTITVANGGTLAPGTGGTPIATLSTGSVTFGATSTYAVALNGTTPTFDRITSSGTVTCAGTLSLTSLTNAAIGRVYTVVSAGTVTGGATFTGLANNAVFAYAGRLLRITYSATTVTLTDVAPTLTARQTLDADGDGQIDGIRLTFDVPLNDNFGDLEVTVGGNPVTIFSSGTAFDNVIDVVLTESGFGDTGATPLVQITANNLLLHSSGSGVVQIEGGSGVAATDAAKPVLLSSLWTDGDANGVDDGDTLALTFSEPVATNAMEFGDLSVPVIGDALGGIPTTSIINQSGSATVTVTLSTAPALSPGGTYSSAILGANKPSGIFLAVATHVADLAAAPNLAAIGNAASAVDVGATPSTLIRIEWNDTNDTIAKTWALGAIDLSSVSASATYTILNAGHSSVSLSATSSDSAAWTVQPAVGSDAFAMKANADVNPDFELTLSTVAVPIPTSLRSGSLFDFSLQFSAPSSASTSASQTVVVTITASQY